MSRSYRHTPIVGNTTAASEKPSKVRAHREERAAVRASLATDGELPGVKRFGNPWKAEKDGKHWWASAMAADLRK